MAFKCFKNLEVLAVVWLQTELHVKCWLELQQFGRGQPDKEELVDLDALQIQICLTSECFLHYQEDVCIPEL